MDTDRIKKIVKDALERPTHQRQSFLAHACDGDSLLMFQASSLLAEGASLAGIPAPPDGAAPTLRRESGFTPGHVLGDRYRIEGRLGSGGMGEVWRAFDLKLRVEVALKVLLPELAGDTRHVEVLRREVRAARNVASPHVCRVFDLLEIDDRELVSMEYVDGQTLHRALVERAPLDLVEARDVALQLLDGLGAIHDAGMIHRDLKPMNVMLTRAGRVVIMDFGLAKNLAETQALTIAGTPAYMAPEQLHGQELGPRSDLYAVGVLLAEMTSAAPKQGLDQLRELWEGLRHAPALVPAGPWDGVIRKAVAQDPLERFATGAELARAIGDHSRPAPGVTEESPYPGLSSFSEEEARFFFGREIDVDTIWRRIQRLQMLAVIGPSGVGKSSFLRAGLFPARPAGWSCVLATPGASPFVRLAEVLTSELPSDATLMRDLLHMEDADTAVSVFRRWRDSHDHALLILDQFEELFTLNPPEVQARFASVLGRIAIEADVHVLLSMRDDFFIHCHEHEALAPVSSEVTILGALGASALRRALVQPAQLCGYRFEDDKLVDEMLAAVRDERGALPLLAFAAAQLWERRDHEQGLITREAYESIGGVSGALARHAEQTLDRIGEEREEIVREIFRNLVTAEHTRVIRERSDLLTVFEDRQMAEQVLDALVDARLLTSFEVSGDDGNEAPRRHRVEVVHESLLRSWPRLVRWQTQDADGAQLRDQLRQAAQLWEQRSRSDDLLWAGSAYQDFALWRERYPGGLTDSEEHFARAMQRRESRRRRARRFATATAFVVLLVFTGVVSYLKWEADEQRKNLIVNQAINRGADPDQKDNSKMLAIAIAGLEAKDDPLLREIALVALFSGPTRFNMPRVNELGIELQAMFSPDGKWLAAASRDSGIVLYPSDGSDPIAGWGLDENSTTAADGDPGFRARYPLGFNADGTRLFVSDWHNSTMAKPQGLQQFGVGVCTFPDGRLLWSKSGPGGGWAPSVLHRSAIDVVPVDRFIGSSVRWEAWDVNGVRRLDLGPFPAPLPMCPALSADQEWLVSAEGARVLFTPVKGGVLGEAREIGRHDGEIRSVSIDGDGRLLGSVDRTGKQRLWSPARPGNPILEFAAENPFLFGEIVTAQSRLYLWVGYKYHSLALDGPLHGEPIPFQPNRAYYSPPAHHPSLDWTAIAINQNPGWLWLYPMGGLRAHSIPLRAGGDEHLLGEPRITSSGHLVTGQVGNAIWVRDLRDPDPTGRSLYVGLDDELILDWEIDETGEWLVVGGYETGTRLVPLSGGEPINLEEAPNHVALVAFDPDGERVAIAGGFRNAQEDRGVRVYSAGGEFIRKLEPADLGIELVQTQAAVGIEEEALCMEFLSETQLLIGFDGHGLFLWDLESGEASRLNEDVRPWSIAVGETCFAVGYGSGSGTILYDRETLKPRELAFPNGWQALSIALSSDENSVAIGRVTASVWIQHLDEDGYHLVNEQVDNARVADLRIDPAGYWLLATYSDGYARYLPIPRGRPLLARPLDEFLDIMRAQTNIRAEVDTEYSALFRWTTSDFPGFDTLPTWQDWVTDEYMEDPPWYSVMDEIEAAEADGS